MPTLSNYVCSTLQVRTRIGIYHGHLREFLRVFPRSQILILKLEDYSLDPAKSMKHIFKFLDLSKYIYQLPLILTVLMNVA